MKRVSVILFKDRFLLCLIDESVNHPLKPQISLIALLIYYLRREEFFKGNGLTGFLCHFSSIDSLFLPKDATTNFFVSP